MEITRSSQYWLREDQIRDIEAFKEQFTYVPKYKDLKSVPTYTVSYDHGEPTYYGFPRNLDPGNGNTITDDTTPGDPIEVDFLGEMYEYQEPVLLDFAQKVLNGGTDLILEADTGSGKTVMLLKMWTMLKVPALVVVPKSDLIKQWIERIKKFTGLEDDDIGLARQKVCDWENKKIVVGMIHSLCKDKYPVEFKQHFGLVVFDELHKLGAYTFSKVGGMFPAKYRLGATATLRRADGLAKVFYAHLGTDVISPLKGDQPKPKIVVVKYPRSSGKIPHWCRSKVQRRGNLFSMLAANQHRNAWLSSLVYEVQLTGRQTLVLSERIVQLRIIQDALCRIHGVSPELVGLYIGGTSDRQKKHIAENCNVILATTGMLALGTDIPTLRGLVFATPLADAEQAIGRICRTCPDTKSPVVIDLVDMNYKDATGWLRGRQKLYGRERWEIVYRS